MYESSARTIHAEQVFAETTLMSTSASIDCIHCCVVIQEDEGSLPSARTTHAEQVFAEWRLAEGRARAAGEACEATVTQE